MLLALALAAVAIALHGVQDSSLPVLTATARQPVTLSSSGYLRPAALVTTLPGSVVRGRPAIVAAPTPASAPAAVAAQPEEDVSPQPQPAFVTYTVQPGDTIASIAASFGIDPQYILWNNSDLSDDPDLLLVGAKLAIPSTNGIIYNVRLNDTLSAVAAYYQIDVAGIVAFVPNGVESADSVIEGMVLVLPGAVPPAPPPEPIPAAVTAVEETAPPPPAPAPQPAAASDPAPVSSVGFIWPWYGNITSTFWELRGGSIHGAIDIDGFGNYGGSVVAAASGQVVLASWSDWGLGLHVVIQHDDGSTTTYAHLSEIYVSQGQYVGQGEAIGALGCTGYCTGTHLHFEMTIDGVQVDPLGYLP